MTGTSRRSLRISWLLAVMLLMGGVTVGPGSPEAHGLLQSQGSGVFEMGPQQWEENYTLVNEDGTTGEYSDDSGTYLVRFEGAATVLVELQLDQSGGSVADVEDRHVAALLPGDSRFVDEFTDVLPGTGDHVTVVLFTSDNLYGQTSSRSGVILVTYFGSSSTSIDRVSIAIGS